MTTESTIDAGTTLHPLDDPVRGSLRGAHRRFATWAGRIGRYDPEVAGFIGHPPVLSDQDFLALIARTQPGPYAPRTIEMGAYLGLRVDGRLVAMAGERLHPPGWTEISAVCTDAEFRGRGIGSRLVRAVGARIRARGETPFLHALARNTTAIGLYETLGFTLRQRSALTLVQAPARP
ncbi:GNAT family N-acetyltransferase [Nocardia wallacei]|uniref:GNAT family N-acetyltransferase n=1 Tax=Nocardia wallacei TaxID=480035 RepID=UPI002457827A|nr:GNAT family N-acetyltransferase [Nocardia wallacei]